MSVIMSVNITKGYLGMPVWTYMFGDLRHQANNGEDLTITKGVAACSIWSAMQQNEGNVK